MNKSRRYNKLLCTLLLAFVGVGSGWAQTTGTLCVVRPNNVKIWNVRTEMPLTNITFTGIPAGAGASIEGTQFDNYPGSDYYYGYCVAGDNFTITLTNFRYEVTSVITRCDRGATTAGQANYTSTPLSGEPQTTKVAPNWQIGNSYYSITVANNLTGLSTITYTHLNGSSGSGNGEWMFLGYGAEGFVSVNYVYPEISATAKSIYKGNKYTVQSSDITWTHQGAFTFDDIELSSSDASKVSVSGKTLTAVSEGTATITATLKNSGSDVTSTTFTVTVDKYALTSDSKNVYVYGSTITDEDIEGAHTFLGSADNDNALVYVEGGSYSGSKSNVVVKNGATYTCANLYLTDSKTASLSVPIAFTASKVTYERPSSTGKWNTIYLPYSPIKKDGYTYYVLSGADLTAGKLTFTEVSGDLAANTPYLIKNTTDDNINESSDESKSVFATTGTSGDATTLTGWSMNGVYERTTFFKDDQQTNYSTVKNTKKIDANSYYIKSDGSGFVVNKDYFNLSAFRGYFSAGTGGGAKATFLTFSTEDEPTAINMVEKNDGTIDMIFDLSGRKLSNAKKGSINIINGKKILVK